MQLSQDLPEGYLFIRACGTDAISVVDRALDSSFLLTPEQVIEDWPVPDIDALDAAAIDAILALDPEVVLLGTGVRQIFPPRESLRPFARRGIGVEVMDNRAASRTYNVLASEGRRVVAALILPAKR